MAAIALFDQCTGGVHERVSRHARYGQVEFEIHLGNALGRMGQIIETRGNRVKGNDVICGCALGCCCGRGRFQRGAHFRQMFDECEIQTAFASPLQNIGIEEIPACLRQNACANLGLRLYQTLGRQGFHGFAQNRTRYCETLGKLCIARQNGPLPDLACNDCPPQLGDDMRVAAAALFPGNCRFQKPH